jgi:hypothetical protein
VNARSDQQKNWPTRPHQFGLADARELLARTVELPSDQRGLLTVLCEYRVALVALLKVHDAANDTVRGANATGVRRR